MKRQHKLSSRNLETAVACFCPLCRIFSFNVLSYTASNNALSDQKINGDSWCFDSVAYAVQIISFLG